MSRKAKTCAQLQVVVLQARRESSRRAEAGGRSRESSASSGGSSSEAYRDPKSRRRCARRFDVLGTSTSTMLGAVRLYAEFTPSLSRGLGEDGRDKSHPTSAQTLKAAPKGLHVSRWLQPPASGARPKGSPSGASGTTNSATLTRGANANILNRRTFARTFA